jgi:hypothetical protein
MTSSISYNVFSVKVVNASTRSKSIVYWHRLFSIIEFLHGWSEPKRVEEKGMPTTIIVKSPCDQSTHVNIEKNHPYKSMKSNLLKICV